ncbi:unnamed protein product [Pieris macdunnoughi]|uniref:Uncharacterized protein n=1 Tax=Pieris macdunnoughi TaxID=345717 RepID=A0A821VLY9_9NEOP|nr:unnamed protein product [Pieris macdunnoughi]
MGARSVSGEGAAISVPASRVQVIRFYLRELHDPAAVTIVACEAAWPGYGRLLLPGPLHLLHHPPALRTPPLPHRVAPRARPNSSTRSPVSRVLHFVASSPCLGLVTHLRYLPI